VTNRPLSQGGEPVAATVILFDTLNTVWDAQAFARLQALKYVQKSGRNDQIAVYSLNTTLRVLQEFTDDRDLLTQVINRYKPEVSLDLATNNLTRSSGAPGPPPPPNGTPREAQGTDGNSVSEMLRMSGVHREDITAAAMATIARHLSGLPGRKKLVWITSSVPMTLSQQEQHNGVTTMEYQDFSPQVVRSLNAMNEGNIGVYPVDPRGVGVDLFDPNLTAMGLMASMTGGTIASPSNDLAGEIEQVMSDTDLTYTLGYYRSGDQLDEKFHSITVRVNRPGVDVRSRRGYEASKPLTVDAKKFRRTLNAWVQEPLEATEIAITARATAADRPGYYRVQVAVSASELQLEQKNGRFVGSFDLAIAPDAQDNPKGLLQTVKVNLTLERLQLALAQGINVTNTVKATNAQGRLISDKLHVVVMDGASVKAGSVRIPIADKAGAQVAKPDPRPQLPAPKPLSGVHPASER